MLNKLSTILNKVEISGFLLLIFPFFDFIFKNFYYFLPAEIFLIFLYYVILYLVLILFSKIAKKYYDIFLVSSSFIISLFYYHVWLLVFCVLLIFVIKKKYKLINIFMIFLLISCLNPYFKLIKNDFLYNDKFIKKCNSNVEFKDVKFSHKPNIYYFYLESYTGKVALKELFEYDNQKFLSAIEDRGFYIWKNSYSNYDMTHSSLYSTFVMKNHYNLIDVFKSISAQKTVMGGKYNSLVNVLKKNGYDINYYFYPTQFVRPFNSDAKFVKLPKVSLLRAFNYIMRKPTDLSDPNFPCDLAENSAFLRRDFIKNLSLNKPQFYFIKFSKIKHLHPMFEYKPNFNENYISNLEITNFELLNIIDFIIKNDKDAVIVLLGDHGSRVFEFSKVSNVDFSLSQFNVLLSIRNPYEKDKNRPEILSNVNVFRYIISTLTDSYDYEKHKRENMSFGYWNIIHVLDGKVFENPVKFKEKV